MRCYFVNPMNLYSAIYNFRPTFGENNRGIVLVSFTNRNLVRLRHHSSVRFDEFFKDFKKIFLYFLG